jgi:hypothetical protein
MTRGDCTMSHNDDVDDDGDEQRASDYRLPLSLFEVKKL